MWPNVWVWSYSPTETTIFWSNPMARHSTAEHSLFLSLFYICCDDTVKLYLTIRRFLIFSENPGWFANLWFFLSLLTRLQRLATGAEHPNLRTKRRKSSCLPLKFSPWTLHSYFSSSSNIRRRLSRLSYCLCTFLLWSLLSFFKLIKFRG